MPARPAPDPVLVQPGLPLRLLETRLCDPPGRGHRRQALGRELGGGQGRGGGEVVGVAERAAGEEGTPSGPVPMGTPRGQTSGPGSRPHGSMTRARPRSERRGPFSPWATASRCQESAGRSRLDPGLWPWPDAPGHRLSGSSRCRSRNGCPGEVASIGDPQEDPSWQRSTSCRDSCIETPNPCREAPMRRRTFPVDLAHPGLGVWHPDEHPLHSQRQHESHRQEEDAGEQIGADRREAGGGSAESQADQ